MTVLHEILVWSKGLADWQQDAIRRLYANRTLSLEDLEDLFALAKAEAGIPDPDGRVATKLGDAEIGLPSSRTRTVVLSGIKDLKNVNAIMDGAHLPIAPAGITVVYGENGVGKSGYSRVFKRACRARDRREPILPNANVDPESCGPAEATFETTVDGKSIDLLWKDGFEPPEPLAEIAIFDSHCARAYIDNQGDFAYSPYGMDIIEGLVGACGKLKVRAAAEKTANAPSDSCYASLVNAGTKVARALLGIPATTSAEDIEILAVLSEGEVDRLALLDKVLAETDPKQRALALRQKASRFGALNQRISTAMHPVVDEKVEALRALISTSNSAKRAAEIAATDFRAVPGQLKETGGEEWKTLFEAARRFSALCHADHSFPELAEEDACPLCQNVLGAEGVGRLGRFDTFIKAAAEVSAREARDAATSAYLLIRDANLDLMFRDSLVEELAEVAQQTAEACTVLQAALNARRTAVLEASAGKLPWDSVPAISADPTGELAKAVELLLEQASSLDATADEERKAAMAKERAELDARRRLSEVKAGVLEAIARHEHCRKLQSVMDAMDARGISRKATDLSRTTASQELADALNAELKLLKVHNLNVVMKPESPGGKTQFKLTLQLPGAGAPAAILSEGEQRAIALGAFMAEIRLGKGSGGVLLDDPVSSLDHRRRWEVAERLARESLVRQVIIFTHDIYFLLILEQKAEEVGAQLSKSYIRRTGAGCGVFTEDLPFDVLGTKARLGRLKQMLLEIRVAAKAGDEDVQRERTARLYGQLRLAWERCVEEVLLNGVVQRFGEGVATRRLKGVVVTDDDYREIDAGMSKSSKFEHDAAAVVGRLPIPDPDEIEADVERLSQWREALDKRVKDIAKQRG